MKLWEYSGKNVRITLKDGSVFEGHAYDYTSALDNEPDPESITIDSIELFAPEIEKVELL
mgnify:CR=1 FL=1